MRQLLQDLVNVHHGISVEVLVFLQINYLISQRAKRWPSRQ